MSRAATNKKRKQNLEAQVKRDRARSDVICGGQKRNGLPCLREAGWGTDHPGKGRCKHHGGSTMNHRASVQRTVALALATPSSTSPGQAIQVALDAAMGEFLVATEQVANLNEGDLFHPTIGGPVPHHWIKFRRDAAERLVRYSKIAADAGIAERAQSLKESQAEMIAGFLQAVIGDIQLTPEQRALVGPAMRRHLSLVSSVEGTATELPLPNQGQEDAA